MILKLQSENLKANDLVEETKTKFEQKMYGIHRELKMQRDEIMEKRNENEKLKAKIQSYEHKLMQLPRLEEQYIRNARSIVRQQEMANTMRSVSEPSLDPALFNLSLNKYKLVKQFFAVDRSKIELKKKEEEMKSLSYWKNRAESLEEDIMRVKEDTERLQLQNRVLLSKYQNLLASPAASSAAAAAAAAGEGGLTKSNASSSAEISKGLSGQVRPRSAAALRHLRSTPPSSSSGPGPAGPGPAAATSAPDNNSQREKPNRPATATGISSRTPFSPTAHQFSQQLHVTINPVESTANSPSHRALSPSRYFRASSPVHDRFNDFDSALAAALKTSESHKLKSMEELAAEETMKLRELVKKKDKQINRLSRLLSFTRAFPLLSAQEMDQQIMTLLSDAQIPVESPKRASVVAMNQSRKASTATAAAFSRKMSTATGVHELPSRKSSTTRGSSEGMDLKKISVVMDDEKGKIMKEANLAAVPYMEDELESLSSGFLKEEEALQQARVGRAVEMQRQFNERLNKKKSSGSPYTSIVRQTKSFRDPDLIYED